MWPCVLKGCQLKLHVFSFAVTWSCVLNLKCMQLNIRNITKGISGSQLCLSYILPKAYGPNCSHKQQFLDIKHTPTKLSWNLQFWKTLPLSLSHYYYILSLCNPYPAEEIYKEIPVLHFHYITYIYIYHALTQNPLSSLLFTLFVRSMSKIFF